MQVRTLITLSTLGPLFLMSCSNHEERFKNQVTKAVNDSPEILTNAMRSHPQKFVRAFRFALDQTKQKGLAQLEQRKKAKRKEAMEVKYRPEQRKDELIQGAEDAPLTLVLYNNFSARNARKAFDIARDLLEQYEGDIKFIYKHLPMEMHANAMISAKYYEALRLQDEELALDFQERLFNNQVKLRKGESYLKKLALDLGANEHRLMQDLKNQEVKKRIEQDIQEAKKFGLQFSPSFVLNGIPITGAYPQDRFQELISKLHSKHYASN